MILKQVSTVLNALEGWAMPFNHGLAAEGVAFVPCAPVYCQIVMALYPYILVQRHKNPDSGPFGNAVALFQVWYRRTQQAKLLEQLERLQTQGPTSLPVIGPE